MNAHIAPEESRSLRLKAATRDSHGALDKRIMAGDIFADRSNFARFLRVQYRFHRSIDALYANPALDALLPDLGERRRLTQVARDLQDLEQTLLGLTSRRCRPIWNCPPRWGGCTWLKAPTWAAPFCTRWLPSSAWTVILAPATWPRIRMARRATGVSSPRRWTRYR